MSQKVASGLVEVKDMYGNRFFVRDEQVKQGRTLLRMHDAETGAPLSNGGDLSRSVLLHRGNICPHPRNEFTRVHVLGDSWMECPLCRARLKAAVARRLAGEPLAPAVGADSATAGNDVIEIPRFLRRWND